MVSRVRQMRPILQNDHAVRERTPPYFLVVQVYGDQRHSRNFITVLYNYCTVRVLVLDPRLSTCSAKSCVIRRSILGLISRHKEEYELWHAKSSLTCPARRVVGGSSCTALRYSTCCTVKTVSSSPASGRKVQACVPDLDNKPHAPNRHSRLRAKKHTAVACVLLVAETTTGSAKRRAASCCNFCSPLLQY